MSRERTLYSSLPSAIEITSRQAQSHTYTSDVTPGNKSLKCPTGTERGCPHPRQSTNGGACTDILRLQYGWILLRVRTPALH